jgi:hypothetical protein
MSQPITDLIQLSKFDLLNLDADIVLSDDRDELIHHMAETIFSSNSSSKFVILVGDQASEEYLVEKLSISSCFIERYNPVNTLQLRMDAAIPGETSLFVWNYFSIPYGELPLLMQKNWKRKLVYAVYLDWTPEQWEFIDGGTFE